MRPAERRALEAVHEELRALIQGGDPQRYHEVNEAFHAAIYAGTHNGYLAEMTHATRSRVQPFRRAQFRNLGRLAKSHVEHDRSAASRSMISCAAARCSGEAIACSPATARICAWVSEGSTSSLSAVSSFSRAASIRQRRKRL